MFKKQYLLAIILLLIILIAFIYFSLIKNNSKNSTTDSSDTQVTITVTQAPQTNDTENKFCGGIAAIECPEEFTCKLDGNYPDAGGICVRGEVRNF